MKKIEKIVNNEIKLILFSNEYIISNVESLNSGFYANDLKDGLGILVNSSCQLILKGLENKDGKINLRMGDKIRITIQLLK